MAATERFEQYEVFKRPDGSLWELGRGAMGITYKANDTDLYCQVALKVINPNILGDGAARDRFSREARSAAALRHENIAAVYRLGKTAEDVYFYAMEFCEGRTLQQMVESAGPLPVPTALSICLQVSRAFAAAEVRHIVHRDIKPANLIIINESNDEGPQVKVIDFGLAKSYAGGGGSSSLGTMGFVGTASFASPEQIEERPLDQRSDIYSLGATLWFALEGRPPFEGALARVMSQHLSAALPVQRLQGRVPGPVIALLCRMLEKAPENRPQNAQDLKNQIKSCIAGLSAVGGAPAAGWPGASPHPTTPPPLPGTPKSPSTVPPPLPAPPSPAALPAPGPSPYPAAAPPLEPARPLERAPGIVGKRYRLIEELSRERGGRVFRAADMKNGERPVVLKEIAPGTKKGDVARQVQLLQQNPHPNMRAVLDFEPEATGGGWVVFEWLNGCSMMELLKARGGLLLRETLLLARPLAAAADHALLQKLPPLDLSKQQVRANFPGESPNLEQLKHTALDSWPACEWKVESMPVAAGAAGMEGGGAEDMMMTIVPNASPTGAGAGPGKRDYLMTLAERIYELLGGSLPGGGVHPRYVPLARLSEAGNALVKSALIPVAAEAPFPSAAEFVQALSATAGFEPAWKPPAAVEAPPAPIANYGAAPPAYQGSVITMPPMPPPMYPVAADSNALWIALAAAVILVILSGVVLGPLGALAMAAVCATFGYGVNNSGLGWSFARWGNPAAIPALIPTVLRQPSVKFGTAAALVLLLGVAGYQSLAGSRDKKTEGNGNRQAGGGGGEQRHDVDSASIAGNWVGAIARTRSAGRINQGVYNLSVALVFEDGNPQGTYFHNALGYTPTSGTREPVNVTAQGQTVQFGYEPSMQNGGATLRATMTINNNQAQLAQRVDLSDGSWIEWAGVMRKQ